MDELRNLEASNAFLVRWGIRFDYGDVPVHASELPLKTDPYNTGAGGGTADYIAMIMIRTSECDLVERWEPRDLLLSLFSSLEW